MKRLFAPIAKVQDEGDGTIKVWGWASTGAQDDDGETIQPAAIKAALPDYLRWGAVREMHQPKAVGTAIEAEVQDDGRTWFGAHIVDPVAVKKVRAEVLKGFSVGGRITGRDDVDKSIITGIKLIEVSVVDRPANPECEITIVKRKADPEDDIADLAEVLQSAPKIDTGALLKAARDLAAKSIPKPRDDLRKGLYNVGSFASCLESLAWVCASSQSDLDYEDDDSPVPAQLRKWVADGVEIFKAMATEESDELVESLARQAGDIIEVIEANAKGTDLMKLNLADAFAKAGAKFSKETMGKLADLSAHHEKMAKAAKDLHGMCKEACDKMDALMPDDDNAGDDAL